MTSAHFGGITVTFNPQNTSILQQRKLRIQKALPRVKELKVLFFKAPPPPPPDIFPTRQVELKFFFKFFQSFFLFYFLLFRYKYHILLIQITQLQMLLGITSLLLLFFSNYYFYFLFIISLFITTVKTYIAEHLLT